MLPVESGADVVSPELAAGSPDVDVDDALASASSVSETSGGAVSQAFRTRRNAARRGNRAVSWNTAAFYPPDIAALPRSCNRRFPGCRRLLEHTSDRTWDLRLLSLRECRMQPP